LGGLSFGLISAGGAQPPSPLAPSHIAPCAGGDRLVIGQLGRVAQRGDLSLQPGGDRPGSHQVRCGGQRLAHELVDPAALALEVLPVTSRSLFRLRQLAFESFDLRLGTGDAKSKRTQKHRNVIEVPWRKTPLTRRREVLVPESGATEGRPIRSESRALLVASIARGRRWLNELMTDPQSSTETIAGREACSVRKINKTISLAFLAPDLVKAAIDGRLRYGLGVARLCDLPAEWSRQRQMLGLPFELARSPR
jgi:hypothetical protein